MPDIPPPREYVPLGPVEEAPFLGFQPPEVRREAFAAVLEGVPLGAYDRRMIEWLLESDDTTCRTIASIMWRCRTAAAPEPGTVTGWGVEFSDDRTGRSWFARYPDEATARERVHDAPLAVPGISTTLKCRQVGPWKEAHG